MTAPGKLLIVDDNENILNSLKMLLKHDFSQVETVLNPNLLPSIIEKGDFDVVLLDMNFAAGIYTGNEGIFWLREILKRDPLAVVIMITAYGDVELAVKAMREGASDFIIKPWDGEKLISQLKKAVKIRQSKKAVHTSEKDQPKRGPLEQPRLVGKSAVMQDLFKTIDKVATTDANILITGENGTGKELVAKQLHDKSNRAGNIFMVVDVGTIPASLFESELFGHVKGAFTDGKEEKEGRVRRASGGTLFLDEIGNLPLPMQSKLLSVLQSRRVVPVGGDNPVPVDIRLISATNASIENLIESNQFREDLYFRINTLKINVPPLRERGDDILYLANHFLKKFSFKYEKPGMKFTTGAGDKLINYPWPGNVRELEHTIEKTVILTGNQSILPEDIMFQEGTVDNDDKISNLKLTDIEKNAIREALQKNGGNLSNAAKELGITRTTLYAKIEKYGL
jgi:DNA-binding NtrC family response regulator